MCGHIDYLGLVLLHGNQLQANQFTKTPMLLLHLQMHRVWLAPSLTINTELNGNLACPGDLNLQHLNWAHITLITHSRWLCECFLKCFFSQPFKWHVCVTYKTWMNCKTGITCMTYTTLMIFIVVEIRKLPKTEWQTEWLID